MSNRYIRSVDRSIDSSINPKVLCREIMDKGFTTQEQMISELTKLTVDLPRTRSSCLNLIAKFYEKERN